MPEFQIDLITCVVYKITLKQVLEVEMSVCTP